MNISNLLELMKNDVSSLTVGQLLLGGIVVSVLSMIVVFIILILIAFFIKVLQRDSKKNKIEANIQEEATTILSEPEPKGENIEELVAVITAAIASSSDNSTNNIVVRRIVKTNNIQGNWEKMTILDIVE